MRSGFAATARWYPCCFDKIPMASTGHLTDWGHCQGSEGMQQKVFGEKWARWEPGHYLKNSGKSTGT